MGRVVRPIRDHASNLEEIMRDPDYRHVNLDISWDEVAKYIVASTAATQITADLINRYPDRFLFGTDEVAPSNREKYTKVFYQYEPLWRLLDSQASIKVRKGNYERVFNEARGKVRSWERAHLNGGAAN
jgi:hypothetical protein